MNGIIYKAYLYSTDSKIDNLPVDIRCPSLVRGLRFRWVQPLCNNATDKEKRWYEEQVLPRIVKEDK
jgi:hypothetical protein